MLICENCRFAFSLYFGALLNYCKQYNYTSWHLAQIIVLIMATVVQIRLEWNAEPSSNKVDSDRLNANFPSNLFSRRTLT